MVKKGKKKGENNLLPSLVQANETNQNLQEEILLQHQATYSDEEVELKDLSFSENVPSKSLITKGTDKVKFLPRLNEIKSVNVLDKVQIEQQFQFKQPVSSKANLLSDISNGNFELKSIKKPDDQKEKESRWWKDYKNETLAKAYRSMDIYDLEPLGIFEKTGHGMVQNIVSLNFAQKNVGKLDLTGVVLNDFIIYRICELIKTKNKEDIATLDLNKTKLNGCRFISIWSLHLLSNAALNENREKSLLQLCFGQDIPVSQRVSCCDQINRTMIHSLEHSNNLHLDLNIADTGKIVIINENNFPPVIISKLVTDSKSIENFTELQFAKITTSTNKTLNVYECTDNFSELVLSERNLVVITYKSELPQSSIISSVLERLLKIANKNILPTSLMILGLVSDEIKEDFVEKFSKAMIDNINKLQTDLTNSVSSFKNENMIFHNQLIIGNQINLNEQLELFKKLINFAMLKLKSVNASLIQQINEKPVKKFQLVQEETPTENDNKDIELLSELLNSSSSNLDGITKSELTELKSLKNPPKIIMNTSEAACIALGLKPTWNEFKKASNNAGQLLKNLRNLKELDRPTMEKLKPYYDNPEFTKDYVIKYSSANASLCAYIRALYEYNIAIEKIKASEKKGTSYQITQPTEQDLENMRKTKTDQLSKYLKHSQELIDELKPDTIKLYSAKSNVNPDENQKLVSEAVCIMLDEKPDFNEFKKLSAKTEEFIKRLKNFDVKTMNSVKLAKLKAYINNPMFHEEKLERVSLTTSRYCGWITSWCNYALGLKELENLDFGPGAPFQTLNEYFEKNAFYTFCWPIYYEPDLLLETENGQKAREKISKTSTNEEKVKKLNGEKFLAFSDYFTDYSDFIKNESYSNIAEWFVVAEVARGNFILDISQDFLITDPTFLTNIISMFNSSKTKSSEFKEISKSIGESVPVWKYGEFREELSKKVDASKIENVLKYLTGLPMIKMIENVKDSDEQTTSLILPLFMFSREDMETNCVHWPSEWNGYEKSITFELFSPVAHQAFFEIAKHFYDVKKTFLMSSCMLINRACGCDILVSFSSKSIELAVRIIDSKKQFNIKDSKFTEFANYVFMEYHLFIKNLLRKYGAVYKLQPFDQQKNDDDQHQQRSSIVTFNNQLIENCQSYYDNRNAMKHSYTHDLICSDCTMPFSLNRSINHIFQKTFPVLKSQLNPQFIRYDKMKSFFIRQPMDVQTNPFFEMALVEFEQHQYNCNSFLINIILSSQKDVHLKNNVAVNFVDKYFALSLPENDEIKIIKSTFKNGFQKIASNLKTHLSSGDKIKIDYVLLDSKSVKLLVWYNRQNVLEMRLGKSILVNIKHYCDVEDNSDTSSEGLGLTRLPEQEHTFKKPGVFLNSYQSDFFNNNIEIKNRKLNLKELIGLRLEAIDIKTKGLVEPAMITEVNEKDEKVLVHFDGWSKTYDYWDNLDSDNLMPAGCMGYLFSNEIQVPLRFSCTKLRQYEKNGSDGQFNWEQYIKDANIGVIPYYLFTESQCRGMPEHAFPCNSTLLQVELTSCKDHKITLFNPDVHLLSFTSIMKTSIERITNFLVLNEERGFLLFPENMNKSFLEMPNLSFNSKTYLDNNQKVKALLPCVYMHSPLGKAKVFAHLLDTEDIALTKGELTNSNLFLCCFMYYVMATTENPLIIPFFEKIFAKNLEFIQNLKVTLRSLNDIMRTYFKGLFEIFCLFFDLDFIASYRYESLSKGSLNQLLKTLVDKEPLLSNFKGPTCSFCLTAEEIQSSNLQFTIHSKMSNLYSKCCMNLVLPPSPSAKPLQLTEDFSEKYSNLLSFSCMSKIKLENEEKFFKKFKKLEKLVLSNNGLTSMPSTISKLKSLEYLEISNNEISFDNIIDCFKKLTNLKWFIMHNLNFDIDDKKLVKIPLSLKHLEISDFKHNRIPFDVENSQLITFKCIGVKLIKDHLISRRNPLSVKLATEFYQNVFSEEQLTKIFSSIHSQKHGASLNKVTYLDEYESIKFKAYVYKSFPRIGDNIQSQSGIPSVIFSLISLKELDLSFQAIKCIPDEINKLFNLTKLKLDGCLLLTSISSQVSILPLDELVITNCPSLKTPPPEIQKRGHKAIMSYLKGLMSGSVACKRTKLMLVGLGEAGKTSLLNCLRSSVNSYGCRETEEECKKRYGQASAVQVTDGINIQDWNIKLKDSSELTYSMWDFAGQSVYYNTHQFFLTARAVYILVWNVRLGAEYAGLDFWLSSISCHAPGAPIFLVGTHIDQVATYSLNVEDLKLRFPQISGFHYVSSYTFEGIYKFSQSLIEATLQQKYMGEEIPKLWFNFEKAVKEQALTKSLISMAEIAEFANSIGLFDELEILQAIRFLADLGSLQYFESSGLKDKVVINPQWIVNVMACIVSIKKTSASEGRLAHEDIKEIWSEYDSSLHQWMLRLTEEFDLTFLVPKDNVSIVPCLLPIKEPDYVWPEMKATSKENKVKEFQVIYTFAYIPAGLFNRIQVRLYNYADSTNIWKNGSLLEKNKHLALIRQFKKTQTIQVKVNGTKPENIIFIIHEVIETLINESYYGITYDYSFPCPDCVEEQYSDPCLFSSNLLKRAHDYKAPFLQCSRYFHAISIQEMMAIMPVEGTSTLDLNIGQSLRDLKQLKKNLKYDVFFWFCQKDLAESTINPMDIVKRLSANKSYNIWYSTDPAKEKMDKITLAIKNSKLVILGISDNFAQNEKCLQVYELTVKVLRSDFLIVEFGLLGCHEWIQDPAFAQVCSDVRVIMQDPERLEAKYKEMLDSIERNIGDIKVDRSSEEDLLDVFISYCWKNSHEAVAKGTKPTETSLGWLDPRTLPEYFKSHGINAWIDVEDINTTNLFGEITKGLNRAKLVVVCISDEYVTSQNCSLEFRFAHVSLRVPIIKAICGIGNEWRKNELAFLSGNYPEINFQYSNKTGHELLLKVVSERLAEIKEKEANQPKQENKEIDNGIDNNSAAFHELYELTQRKFLGQMIKISQSDQSTSKQYPRLFCIDLIEKHKVQALESLYKKKKQQKAKDKHYETNKNAIEPEQEKKDMKDEETISQKQIESTDVPAKEKNDAGPLTEKAEGMKKLGFKSFQSAALKAHALSRFKEQTTVITELVPCIRVMCEAEDGWHLSSSFILVSEFTVQFATYFSRIMNILKNGSVSNQMNIFCTDQGSILLGEINSKASKNDKDVPEGYLSIRSSFIDELNADKLFSLDDFQASGEDLSKLSLERCELKNHKILWLCKKHIEKLQVKVLNENAASSDISNENNAKILDELELINSELININ